MICILSLCALSVAKRINSVERRAIAHRDQPLLSSLYLFISREPILNRRNLLCIERYWTFY